MRNLDCFIDDIKRFSGDKINLINRIKKLTINIHNNKILEKLKKDYIASGGSITL